MGSNLTAYSLLDSNLNSDQADSKPPHLNEIYYFLLFEEAEPVQGLLPIEPDIRIIKKAQPFDLPQDLRRVAPAYALVRLSSHLSLTSS